MKTLPKIFAVSTVLILGASSINAQVAESFMDLADGMPAPTAVLNTATIEEFGNCTFYATRVEFDEACGDLPIEGFDGSGVGMSSLLTCFAPINSINSNCFPAGALLPGFNLSGDGGPSDDVVVLGAGFLGLPSDMAGPNNFLAAMNITFDAPDVTAIAFDLYLPIGGPADVQIDLLDASNNIIGTTVISAVQAETPTFVGMSTTSPIARVVINSVSGDGGEIIDNLSFGACKTIPTMSQWALMILGLILTSLAVVRIRKSKLAVS